MKNKLKTLLIAISYISFFNGGIAGVYSPATPLDSVRQYVMISNGLSTKQLKFGLDPQGTDSIDLNLGEFEIPPMPPSGVFEARFIGTNLNPPLNIGQGLWTDIRYGDGTFIGIKYHQLSFQREYNATDIYISWNFSAGITGKLYDLFGGIIVNDTMFGSGGIIIQNTGIEKLFMKIYYNHPGVLITPINSEVPNKFTLYYNYPNPFNSYTKINFDVDKSDVISLKIYDLQGREVLQIFNQHLAPGKYSIVKNFDILSSGVYIVLLKNSQQRKINKITLIK